MLVQKIITFLKALMVQKKHSGRTTKLNNKGMKEEAKKEKDKYMFKTFVITSMIITTGVCWIEMYSEGDCIHFD